MYTEEWLDKMDKVLKVMESEPAFDKSRRYFMGREEKIKVALLKDKRFLEIVK
jgi:acyl-CoA oxidase